AHYENALEVRRREVAPADWAMTEHALGNLWLRRYERSGEEAHAQAAEAHYRNALLEYRREVAPADWAMTEHALGNLWLRRYERSGEEAHAQAAEAHYENALEVRRREVAPADWAMTEHALGNLWLRRYERSGEEAHAQAAEAHLRNALQEYRREVAPSQWATVQHSLGNLWLRRYERSGEEAHAQAAEAHYRNALEVRRREVAPSHWATVQHSLGNLFARRYERSGEEAHAQAAEAHYLAVLSQNETSPLPSIFPFRSHAALTRLYFRQKDWAASVRHFIQVNTRLTELLAWQNFRSGKESWLRETRGLAAQAAFAHLRLGQPVAAVEALESGRARLLGEALERQRRDLENLAALGRGDLHERYREAAQRYDELLRQLSDVPGRLAQAVPPRLVDWLSRIQAAQAELNAVIAEIRQVPGYETFLKTLTAQQIRALAQEAPLVYLAATQHGGLALVVTGDSVRWVELPCLTEASLRRQVVGDEGQNTYLRAYLAWRTAPYNDERRDDWEEVLDKTCAWLWEALMEPVLAALRENGLPEGSRVVLIPSDWLALLPLHAAWMPDDTPPCKRRYALDEYTFTYAPSAQALYHARTAANRPADSLLAVENPRGDLPFTPREVEAAMAHFVGRSRRLAEQEATRAAVMAAIPQANVLHFSTHGLAGWGEAETAHLVLADGVLTLREVYGLRLEGCRLVVLSACETAVPGLEMPDEMIALPSGWMQAGVPGVVGSLWSVNDLSTAMLIARFYDLWRGQGLPFAQALRQAQRWLRDLFQDEAALAELERLAQSGRLRMTAEQAEAFLPAALLRDFRHPYHWAAFTFTGL
ncbi:hypothetical protein SE15_06680, partial [Thermanaerothrix daxensis]